MSDKEDSGDVRRPATAVTPLGRVDETGNTVFTIGPATDDLDDEGDEHSYPTGQFLAVVGESVSGMPIHDVDVEDLHEEEEGTTVDTLDGPPEADSREGTQSLRKHVPPNPSKTEKVESAHKNPDTRVVVVGIPGVEKGGKRPMAPARSLDSGEIDMRNMPEPAPGTQTMFDVTQARALRSGSSLPNGTTEQAPVGFRVGALHSAIDDRSADQRYVPTRKQEAVAQDESARPSSKVGLLLGVGIAVMALALCVIIGAVVWNLHVRKQNIEAPLLQTTQAPAPKTAPVADAPVQDPAPSPTPAMEEDQEIEVAEDVPPPSPQGEAGTTFDNDGSYWLPWVVENPDLPVEHQKSIREEGRPVLCCYYKQKDGTPPEGIPSSLRREDCTGQLVTAHGTKCLGKKRENGTCAGESTHASFTRL